jgi:hypothetical protein
VNRETALQIIDEASGDRRIKAALDTKWVRGSSGYRVELVLRRRLRMIVKSEREWESVRVVWNSL